MKKIILSAFFAVAVFTVNAQTKITKTNVVGKWAAVSITLDEMLYYNIDKDSISLTKEMSEKLAASGQDTSAIIDQMKTGLGTMKDFTLTFKSDGSYSIEGPQEEKGTYTVDETTGTITINSPKDGKQELKAEFKKANLMVKMPSPGGMGPAPTMELKKS